jgi:hypothetical protein
MTRDEAIEIDFNLSVNCSTWEDETLESIRAASVTAIDSYIALGLLKIDADPTTDQRINKAINYELCSSREKCAGNIKEALNKAGFEIVEKKP